MARVSFRVHFEGGSGARLAGIVDRPDNTSEDRDSKVPVAVFSHCFTCNKDLKAIVRISRMLAELGVAVLRYDMTGLGGSEGEFSETNFTTNLADLRSAIAFAEQELGDVSTLIGHSFGGAASLAIAGSSAEARAPNLSDLSSVIALAAPSDTSHLARLLLKMDPEIQNKGVGEVVIGGLRWKINQQMIDDFQSHDLPGLISKIRVPTLLFHSSEDETLGIDHAMRIASLMNQQPDNGDARSVHRCSLVTLPGADHLLVRNQRDIEFVATMMAAFINRYAAPTLESQSP